MKKIIILIIICLQHASIFAEFKSIQQQVNDIEQKDFRRFSLFKSKSSTASFQNLAQHVTKFDIVETDGLMLSEIANASLPYIEFSILINGNWENIHLVKNKSISENIQFTTQNNSSQIPFNYRMGSYYYGIIDNLPNATISISFFEDNIMGLILTDNGNYVIGKSNLKNPIENEYIIYNDKNLIDVNSISCATTEAQQINQPHSPIYTETITSNCVKIFFDCDYAMYQSFSNNVTTTNNYVTGLFNMISTLYLNDSISTAISQINVWTSTDPYASFSTTSDMLTAFSSQMSGGFNGDLAHMLSTRNAGGGIAWLDVFCGSNYYKTGLSASLSTSLTPLPTYSWNTEVVTHELGHNMGSPHTHACAWNGNNTRIDNCAGNYNVAYQEGTCNSFPTNPAIGGTIMSYCHLQAVGINLSLGFGPQPGALIRANVNTANCLTPCINCDGGISITGNFATPLTESSTWITATGQTTISPTTSVKLDANPANGYILISPSSNSNFFVSNPSSTNAQFIAQAYNGCNTGAPLKGILPSGEENNVIENGFTLYPNPAFSSFTIQNFELSSHLISFQILSIEGRILFTTDNILFEGSTTFDIQTYSKGFYFIKIICDGKIDTIKFQKE